MSSISELTHSNDNNNDPISKEVKQEVNEDENLLKQNCLDLQSKISKVENNTSLLSLAISRSIRTVKRLRTEYLVLLELLERKSKELNQEEEEEIPSSPDLELNDINQLLQDSISRLSSSKTHLTNGNGSGHGGRRAGAGAHSLKRGPRKIKDPNFPKRPTNAYLLFCEGEKERVKSLPLEEQEKIPDLSKHLTERWKALDDEGRKPFYKIYEQDKERFTKELEEYEKKKKLETSGGGGDASETPQPVANTDTPDAADEEDEEEDIDDDELTHPLVKKIKLEDQQLHPPTTSSPTPSSPLAQLETESPTPAPQGDITGIEDDEDDDDDDDDEEDLDEDEEEDEDDEDVVDTTLPVAVAEEEDDEDVEMADEEEEEDAVEPASEISINDVDTKEKNEETGAE